MKKNYFLILLTLSINLSIPTSINAYPPLTLPLISVMNDRNTLYGVLCFLVCGLSLKFIRSNADPNERDKMLTITNRIQSENFINRIFWRWYYRDLSSNNAIHTAAKNYITILENQKKQSRESSIDIDPRTLRPAVVTTLVLCAKNGAKIDPLRGASGPFFNCFCRDNPAPHYLNDTRIEDMAIRLFKSEQGLKVITQDNQNQLDTYLSSSIKNSIPSIVAAKSILI